MAKKAVATTPLKTPAPAVPRQKPSVLLDTRVIYCGDNLEQLAKLPDACVDRNPRRTNCKEISVTIQHQ
jgi:hypothetical protein